MLIYVAAELVATWPVNNYPEYINLFCIVLRMNISYFHMSSSHSYFKWDRWMFSARYKLILYSCALILSLGNLLCF
jgi:hypothetical protein